MSGTVQWHGHVFVRSWDRHVPGSVCIAANHSPRGLNGKVSGVWLSFVEPTHPCRIALNACIEHDRARDAMRRMKAMPGPVVPPILYHN